MDKKAHAISALRVLVVDDEEKLRSLLARILSLEGFEVAQAADGRSALRNLEQQEVAVVLCDVKLPDANGVDLAGEIRQKYPQTEVILMTAHGQIADGVRAIKNGAFDYLVKGDENHRIVPLLHQAFEKRAQGAAAAPPSQPGSSALLSFEQVIGSSPAIREAVALGKKVAPTDATVLLTGETGTGKEVFAQAIHAASRRAGHPFVAINSAAISRDLLESELFGHQAGAFTGAVKDKKGLLEEAQGGTLFLDEIGEMDISLQAKLLRVLESGSFYRVGGSKPLQMQARVIAATNRDLQREAEAGRFRLDLYYRLSVFSIVLPPLRERPGDLRALAQQFVSRFAAAARKPVPEAEEGFWQALALHAWPGNVRELRNVIERSVILAEDGRLSPDLLPAEIQYALHQQANPARMQASFDLADAERLHIERVLRHTGGNKTEAARLLHIALTTLYRKLEKYGLGE